MSDDDEFVAARQGLYQTEPMRLQAEANQYTRQVEHERKRLLILTDTYKQTHEQLLEIKQKIEDKINENSGGGAKKTKKALTGGDFHDRLYPEPQKIKTEDQEKAYLKSLKNKLEHEKVLLNNIKGDNKGLYVRITSMRHEISFAKESIRKMEEAIQKFREETRQANKEGFNYARQASETNN